MNLIDKYLGEAKIPKIDYEKIGPNDWIIYDEGTGTIEKIIKNKANRNIDVSKHFVSSKSAGMKASQAVKKYSWLFLKRNKGFSKLIKTMSNIHESKNLKFADLDTSNKGSMHGGGQWTALIKGKTYTWNYVHVKNGKWQVTNKPEEAEAIALSTEAGKKLKTAKIIKKR